MARDPDFVLKYLTEVEELAEDILTDKQQIVDLDMKRNTNREALRAIKNTKTAPTTSNTKTWLNMGGMFIKVDTTSTVDMLNSDQAQLDEEINKLRNNLHEKVNKLRDAEGQADLKGYDLKAMNCKDIRGLKTVNLLH